MVPPAIRVMVTFLVVGSIVVGAAIQALAGSASVVRTPADAIYEVHLRSGATGRVWRGHGSITFTNVGGASLPEVYLRVWSNGVLGCEPRSIAVSSLVGGQVTDERLACTELEVTLDEPLAPGSTTTIVFDLRIQLPGVNDRFGFHRGLALVGTALPTLAVHDDAGWHRVPFENLGESFYSLAADYEVTFATPPRLDVAATGVVTARTETASGRTRTRFVAERVRDFAWAAGGFRTVERRSGGVDVVVSYQPERVSRIRARSASRSAVRAMRVFREAFGGFPWPEVDVVLTGADGLGGMEYPTIVFSVPQRITIAHELAHQWFYAAVGNDQYREPWLDESFATWAMRLPFGARRGCAGISWPSDEAALTNDMGYWSTHPAQYRLVYDGGSCMLANLSKRFGRERFVRIIGRYVERHRLGIARTEDFVEAIEAAAARHLDGFDAAAFWSEWRVATP